MNARILLMYAAFTTVIGLNVFFSGLDEYAYLKAGVAFLGMALLLLGLSKKPGTSRHS